MSAPNPMTFTEIALADPQRLVDRARQLVELGKCPCVYSGLAAAKHEIELEQRTALTIAVAKAYDIASGMTPAKTDPPAPIDMFEALNIATAAAKAAP